MQKISWQAITELIKQHCALHPHLIQDLTSDRDVWVYTSSTAPIPIIRNEELILFMQKPIYKKNLSEGEKAINVIRSGHGVANYNGAVTKDALINEMLYQRRYSLFYEGHRWVDMRRYDRLGELPIDRSRRPGMDGDANTANRRTLK